MWSLMKTGTKDPRAGSMKSRESHLTFEHAPLMLKIRKSSTIAAMRTSEMALVAKIPLQTILPIKNG